MGVGPTDATAAIIRTCGTSDDVLIVSKYKLCPSVRPAVRRLRVSGGAVGLHLRRPRRAQRSLWSDCGAGGAFSGAARLVSGQNHGSDAPTGDKSHV